MDDNEVLARIQSLVDEEHHLETGEPTSAEQQARIEELEVALDQCWDLLRQRRARRDAGFDPDTASARSEGTVEGYQQ